MDIVAADRERMEDEMAAARVKKFGVVNVNRPYSIVEDGQTDAPSAAGWLCAVVPSPSCWRSRGFRRGC